MAVTDEERLIVALEAKVNDFEKKMQAAERRGTQTYQGLQRGSKRATQQMEQDMLRTTTRINQALATVSTRIGDFGKAFATTTVTAGIAGFVAALKSSVESTAELSRQARMAGMDVERFQELKFAAEQNRIGVDALTDGLKELQLRVDEFVQTGSGSAAESLQRLGYTSEELAEKLKNPSALFVEIIGRMKELDRAARIRIGDEIFGGSAGERFVELVDQGAEGLQENIRLANDLGLVMSREVVKTAEDVDRKFNIIATTIGTRVKAAIVDAISAWFTFLDSYKQFEEQQNATLKGRQADIGRERLDLENQRLATPKSEENVIRKIDEKLRRLAEEDARITNVRNNRLNSAPAAAPATTAPPRDMSGDYIRNYREELAKSNRERAIAAELEKILSDASSHGAKLTREQATALAEETVARKEKDDASKKSAAEAERAATRSEHERDRIRDVITELEREIAVVWEDESAKRALEASRLAGKDATEEERQKIIDLTETLWEEEKARERNINRINDAKDMTRSALHDIKDAMEDGKITWKEWGEIASNVLSRISDKLLDLGVDALFDIGGKSTGGGIGGFLGKLFSFDGGGHTGNRPRSGGLDGKGGFLAMVHPRETIIDHTKQRSGQAQNMSAAGGQKVHVTSDVRVTVDKEGSIKAYVERTASSISQQTSATAIGQYDKNLPGRVQDIQERNF